VAHQTPSLARIVELPSASSAADPSRLAILLLQAMGLNAEIVRKISDDLIQNNPYSIIRLISFEQISNSIDVSEVKSIPPQRHLCFRELRCKIS
jgi:hypothetical protein